MSEQLKFMAAEFQQVEGNKKPIESLVSKVGIGGVVLFPRQTIDDQGTFTKPLAQNETRTQPNLNSEKLREVIEK